MVKRGERRETFDERKRRVSFERALQKRPVASHDVDAAVRAIVNDLRRSGEREVPSRQVGELVMRELKNLDQVAYVRFARSEEHTYELQSLMRISYAVFCLKTKNKGK